MGVHHHASAMLLLDIDCPSTLTSPSPVHSSRGQPCFFAPSSQPTSLCWGHSGPVDVPYITPGMLSGFVPKLKHFSPTHPVAHFLTLQLGVQMLSLPKGTSPSDSIQNDHGHFLCQGMLFYLACLALLISHVELLWISLLVYCFHAHLHSYSTPYAPHTHTHTPHPYLPHPYPTHICVHPC